MNTTSIVQELWNYCSVLRDDGMSYGDYVEQLTYLLFLKMAEERTKAPYNQKSPVPEKYSWLTLPRPRSRAAGRRQPHACRTTPPISSPAGFCGRVGNCGHPRLSFA